MNPAWLPFIGRDRYIGGILSIQKNGEITWFVLDAIVPQGIHICLVVRPARKEGTDEFVVTGDPRELQVSALIDPIETCEGIMWFEDAELGIVSGSPDPNYLERLKEKLRSKKRSDMT